MTSFVAITAILEFIMQLVGCDFDCTGINIVVYYIVCSFCEPEEDTMVHVRMSFGGSMTGLLDCDWSTERPHVFEVWFMTAPSFTRGLFNCGVVSPVKDIT